MQQSGARRNGRAARVQVSLSQHDFETLTHDAVLGMADAVKIQVCQRILDLAFSRLTESFLLQPVVFCRLRPDRGSQLADTRPRVPTADGPRPAWPLRRQGRPRRHTAPHAQRRRQVITLARRLNRADAAAQYGLAGTARRPPSAMAARRASPRSSPSTRPSPSWCALFRPREPDGAHIPTQPPCDFCRCS
jgi:hypothetical protein